MVDWIRAYKGEFETMEELVELVETINKDMNRNIHHETEMSPTALFYKEKEYLKPLPNKNIIDTYLTSNKYKVSAESLIRYGANRYSVDQKLIGEVFKNIQIIPIQTSFKPCKHLSSSFNKF